MDKNYQKIQNLTELNFGIQKGKKGPLLFNDIEGISCVLFYKNDCKYCEELKPHYIMLPYEVPLCKFLAINLDVNKKVVAMSKNTIMPFKYVPQIILYLNGKPFLRYDGPRDNKNMSKFINEVVSRMKTNDMNMFSKVQEKRDCGDIDCGVPYNIVCDNNGMCYMTTEEVYDGKECGNGECCFLTDSEL